MASPNIGSSLREETWTTLVSSVVAGECTPFLGAGVAAPYLPTGGELSRKLAKEFLYPLKDTTNLARVAQYVACEHDVKFVKRYVCQYLKERQTEAETELDRKLPTNHVRLARLKQPLYLTTNYDDYLQRAILETNSLRPLVDFCRWERRFGTYQKHDNVHASRIFHLHGHLDEHMSLLLTEDDYVDFMVNLALRNQRNPVIPPYIREALAETNLLFIGYSLEDWNFRFLMRHLTQQLQLHSYNKPNSISIQLSDDSMESDRRKRAEKFLEKYLDKSSSVDVYWGDASLFLEELESRVGESRR